MKRTNISIIFLVLIFIYAGCSTENPENPNVSVKAIGTYHLSAVDKNIWSDFQLVLEIDKAAYLYKEPIPTKLYFKNIGIKKIKLNIVISETQLNNPPTIDIWSKDGRKYMVHKVVDNLQDTLTIQPKTSALLMQFDLINIEGIIYHKDPISGWYAGSESPNMGNEFTKGTYYMKATFIPQPYFYGSITDTLSFEIN